MRNEVGGSIGKHISTESNHFSLATEPVVQLDSESLTDNSPSKPTSSLFYFFVYYSFAKYVIQRPHLYAIQRLV